MRVQIYIDGKRLDLFNDEQITVRSSVQDVNDISKLFADFSQSFTVPASDNNNDIFKGWYNADIDSGYDARLRKSATIDVDTLDFKRGKMRLDKVKMVNGQPANYRITFFGDIIKVKDLIGDDKLSSLTWLDGFDHSYTDTNVKVGLTTGLDFMVDSISYEEAIIYPLISYQRQYLINADITDKTSTDVLVNIAYDSGRSDGVFYTELKPAIKLHIIVKAIEKKYGLTFTGDFFDSAEFTNIYMNLNKTTENLASGIKLYENHTGTYNFPSPILAAIYETTITPDSGFEDVEYKIRLTIDSRVVYESPNWLQGVQTKLGTSLNPVNGEQYTITAEIITREAFTFDAVTTFSILRIDGSTSQTTGSPYNSQSVVLTTTIVNELPNIKTYEFLTSLFKMFNLVIVPDGEDIEVNDLQAWYAAGAIHDITKYVETDTETITRGKIHNEINFKFEESDQILADEFNQSNNQIYGNLEFKLVDENGDRLDDVDGDTLDIEVIFENPIFERLFDLNTNNEAVVQYCLYTDRDIKSIAGNPFLFYAPSVSVAANSIGYKGSGVNYTEINTSIYMPSHSIQISTNSFTLNFNSELNEYTGSLFTDTIFDRYYKDYITDIFSIKRRMYNYKAILPNSLLNILKLNDRLVIADRRYLINSINSNLVIRGDELELINDIYDAPLASDLLSGSLFVPSSQIYDSQARSATAKYIGLSGKTISKVDTGDGVAFLTVVESTTADVIQTVNFSITLNETGDSRTVQIKVTDGVNDPKFTIVQNTVFNPSFDFSDFRNTQMLPTIFIRA